MRFETLSEMNTAAAVQEDDPLEKRVALRSPRIYTPFVGTEIVGSP
jgi:hypothetical protein